MSRESARSRCLGELLDEPGLTDTGLAAHIHTPPVAFVDTCFEKSTKLNQLRPPADERRAGSVGRRLLRRPNMTKREDRHRLGDALDQYRVHGVRRYPDPGEHMGRRRQLDLTRLRRLLHPCRHGHGRPRSVVLHLVASTDREDDNLTGVETDPYLNPGAVAVAYVVPDGLLHLERRLTRFHSMLLACHWCAEHGHHTIAHKATNRASILLDRRTHAFRDSIEQLVGFFRVELFGEGRRTGDVGK